MAGIFAIAPFLLFGNRLGAFATATIQELDLVRPVAVCSTAFFAEMAPDIILSL
jgi:hypothetical protein